MKIFFLVVLIFSVLNSRCQNFFDLKEALDSTYGYSNQNPIKIRVGNQNKSLEYSIRFLQQLMTADGQNLLFFWRGSVSDPNYKQPLLRNRFTGMPLNGKLGILDKYIFITETKKDTIILYIDVYNRGKLQIPQRLKLKQN